MPDIFDEVEVTPQGDIFDEVASVPVEQNAQLNPAPTFGQRIGRAFDTFQAKVRPSGIADALDPFRFTKALGSAAEELAPEARDFISPLIGPSESQKIEQAMVPNPNRSKIETEGLIPGVVGELSQIDPLAEAAESVKSQPDPNDNLLLATGKAAKNVALDVGVSLASPMGALLLETGTLAPKATSAALTPLVLKSISESAKSVASDETDQQKIEKVLMSIIGVSGTAAALHTPSGVSAPKVPKTTPATGIAAEAVEGATALESALGIPAPLTAAESTGAVGTARREAFVKRIGAGDGTRPLPYQLQQEAISDAVQKVVREGAAEAGQKSEVGASVAQEITTGEEALRGRTARKAGAAAEEASGAARSGVRAVGPEQEASALGTRIRDAMQFSQQYDKARGQNLYSAAEQARIAAGGPSEFVDPNQIRATAKAILEDAPKREVEVDTGIVDATGTPIKATKREVMPQFLPAYQKIQELSKWNTPQTAEEITRARSLIGESIGKIESGAADMFGGGFQLGDLKRLYAAISNDFDTALAKLSPDARAKYKTAQDFHRQNVEKFEQSPIISKVINQASEGGIPNTGEIASRFARGEGKLEELKAIKTYLPAADYNALKAGILDSLRSRNTIPTASGHVEDMTGFAKSFRELAPEFKRELMGSDKAAATLQSVLDRFGVVKQGAEELGQRKVATPEAMQALIDDIRAGKSEAGQKKFGQALAMDAARSRDYFNAITKDIRSGNLGKVPVDPARFVDDFLLKTDDVNVVRTSLQQLSSETRENVRRLVSQKFFELAADQDNSTLAQLIRSEPELSGSKLIDIFIKDPKRREVLQALIPEEHKDLITNFIKYQRGIENARKLGGQSGLVSSQAQFGGRMGSSIVGIIPQLAESVLKLRINRFVARAFFSKPAQEIMKKAVTGDFLSVAVAAAALAKVGDALPQGVKTAAKSTAAAVPKLTRDDLMTLSGAFGATKIREYLNSKKEMDGLMATMPEDDIDAFMIAAPEIATPITVEGDQPAASVAQLASVVPQPVLRPEASTPAVAVATPKPDTVEIAFPNGNGRVANTTMSRADALKRIEDSKAQVQRIRERLGK